MTKQATSEERSLKKAAECVSGVLMRHSEVLVEKRRLDEEADPGLVFLPGGHVEPRESLGEALEREMREELGIRIRDFSPVHVRHYTASNGERQRIHYFHVKNWAGTIRSHEAERVYWESDTKSLSDATERRIVQRLLSHYSRL